MRSHAVATVLWLAAAGPALLPAPVHAQATTSRGASCTVSSEAFIQAPPDRVWETLTVAKGFCALTGLTAKAPGLKLAFIGETVPAAWGADAGMLVVTRSQKPQELRVSFEPAAGAYLAQAWVTLAPEGKGSRLKLVERRTVADTAAADRAAAQIAAGKPRQLAAFKAMAERGR
jgi:uncharacterized protein YndB with AHSA1/START domain